MTSSPEDLARALREELLRSLGSQRQGAVGRDGLRRRVEEALAVIVEREALVLSAREREGMIQEVLGETVGLGPLDPLLADPSVTEIMVNGPGRIFVEQRGSIREAAGLRFRDEVHLRAVIERILAPLGRRLDELCPIVDARLPDGSRVNAVLAPIAYGGPVLTVRRFSRRYPTLAELVQWGTLSAQAAALLQDAVRQRKTILISGGASTGKTTLLNALTACLPATERVVVVEDTLELQLRSTNSVRLEARPPNLEGSGEVGLDRLVRNALRMRPDRIILGEVRGAEALELLQVLNVGHRGSLCTIHANSARDALRRLELLCLVACAGSFPLAALREFVGSAVQLLVHLERAPDGSRRVEEICALGMGEGQDYRLQGLAR